MKKKKISIRRWVIVAFTGLLLAITSVWGYQIENYHELIFDWSTTGMVLLFWALIGALLLLVFSLFDRAKVKPSPVCANWSKGRMYLVFVAALLVVYGIHFLALYPGLFVFDAPHQMEIYTSGMITEHHPVLHTLIVGFLITTVSNITGSFNHGVAVYTIVQIFVAVLCFAYVLTYVHRKVKNWWITGISFFLLSCFTPIVLQVLSLTKDSYFFVVLVLASTLTIEMVDEQREFMDKKWKGILWMLSVVCTAIFRNNCIYAIPFLLVGVLLCVKEKRKTLLLLLGGVVVLGLLYSKVFVPAVTVRGIDQRELFSVPIQQMARIYYDEEADVTDKERTLIKQLITKEGIEGYVPTISDPAKNHFDMELYQANASYYNRLYLDLMLRNPKLSLDSFLENTCGFWYPGCELTLLWDGTKGYWVTECYWPAQTNSKIDFLYEYYKLFESSDFVTGNTVTAILFAPGTFFYLFVIMFAYAIENKRKSFCVVFGFVFVLWLTYLLGPVALVRYAIYLYALVPLYLIQVLGERKILQRVK